MNKNDLKKTPKNQSRKIVKSNRYIIVFGKKYFLNHYVHEYINL